MTTLVADDRLGALANVPAVANSWAVASLSNGGFVTLSSGTNNVVTASIYDAAGQRVGADIQVAAAGRISDVVGTADGGFAVAWRDGPTSVPFGPGYASVKAQIFDANGVAHSAPTTVSAPDLYEVGSTSIDLNSDGTLAVSWTQYTIPVNPTAELRIIDGGGTPLGPQATFSTGINYWQDVAALAPDQVAFAITTAAPSSTENGNLTIKVFDPVAGTFAAQPLLTMTAPSGTSYQGVRIARLSSGNLAVGWGEQTGSTSSLHTQIYTPAGAPVGAAATISSADVGFFGLTERPDGGFAIAFHSGAGVKAELFDSAGAPVGDAFVASQLPAGSFGTITSFGTDDLAIAYTSYQTDPNGNASTLGAVALYYSTTNGTAAGETLDGTAGRDILRGLGGADTLHGLDGNDVLIGGTGADVLDGGAGIDMADYSESDASVTVSLAANSAAGGTAEGDTLIGIERLTGSAFADVLTGDAGDNRLDGGDGDDRLVGGAGADVLIGNAGIDTVDYSASTAGVTANLLTGIGQGGDAEGDSYQSVERLIGSAFADTLIGNVAANVLSGGGGDDVLIGGVNADTLDGGSGTDTASYETSANGVIVNLAAGTASFGDAQGDTLISIENLRGSNAADTLTGDGGANRIEGLDGGDTLTGGLGTDILIGGAGDDMFRDTAAGLNGDTITDLTIGDRIVITDATLTGFTFARNGDTLVYAGGTLTLANLAPDVQLAASAASGGGVQLTIVPPPPPPPVIAHVQSDFNGDGRSDILWRNVGGQLSDWLGKTNGGFTTNDGNALTSAPTNWHVAGTGDFNGDGRSDILWRNDSGQLSDWLGQTNGSFAQNDANAFTAAPTSWHVAGTGDFNGDGRADILWRSDSGQLSDWLGKANGGFSQNDANAFTGVPTSWKIAGTGDFNGDGRADILWRNDNGQLSDWLGQANGGFAQNDVNALASVPTSWHVAGTGDFNGDGRADILWRNDNGQLSDWLGQANGGFIQNDANALTSAPNSWHVVETGDYNGDGRSDILWRNDSGQLSDWLGKANGGFVQNDANAFTSAPTSWITQPIHDLLI